MQNSLRKILSSLSMLRVTSSPNHSNGATIQHMFGSAPIGAVSQHTNSLATLGIPLGAVLLRIPTAALVSNIPEFSENGTSPYPSKGTKIELLNTPGSVGNYLMCFIAYPSDGVFVKGFLSLVVSYHRKNTDVGDGFTLKTAKLTIFPSAPC